ncbi:MAG: RNA methyltransferase [Clostridiales bacterium]|jgi:TrmH family RNA methyltransferase|nr:RNA methyltransferase [Clostridiales bacterium]
MELISGLRGASAKKLRALKKRAAREELGLAFIEGRRLVADAMAVSGLVRELYVSESFARSGAGAGVLGAARAAGIEPALLADSAFEGVADTKTPQGVMAIIRAHPCPPGALAPGLGGAFAPGQAGELAPGREGELAPGRGGFAGILVMDRVSDPGNAGTMIRTAEAAGFSGVAMSDGCVDLYSPKTLRAAMGSAFRVPVATGVSLLDWLPELKAGGFAICAAAPGAGGSCFGEAYARAAAGDLALVIGSEAEGVREQVMALCDCRVGVPMLGGAESLNAAVAAGVLMYEALRRRSDAGRRKRDGGDVVYGSAGACRRVRDKAVPADAEFSESAPENWRQGDS